MQLTQIVHISASYIPELNSTLQPDPITFKEWILLVPTAASNLVVIETISGGEKGIYKIPKFPIINHKIGSTFRFLCTLFQISYKLIIELPTYHPERLSFFVIDQFQPFSHFLTIKR